MARVPVVKFKPVYGVPPRDLQQEASDRRAQGLDDGGPNPVGRPRVYGPRMSIQLHLPLDLLEKLDSVRAVPRVVFIAQAIEEALDRLPKPADREALIAKRLAESEERRKNPKPSDPSISRKKY